MVTRVRVCCSMEVVIGVDVEIHFDEKLFKVIEDTVSSKNFGEQCSQTF